MNRLIACRIARSLAMVFLLLTIAGAVSAQQVVSTTAGIIQCVEGDVFLEGKLLQLPRLPHGSYLQMENGQSLRTMQGRMELLLNSYIYLRLGENGLLRMEQNQLNDSQLALEQGSVLIEVVQELPGNRTRLRFSTGIVEIRKAGLYRLDAGSGEFRVYGGAALVTIGNRQKTIKTGRMVHLDGDFASPKFNANDADSLHQWAAQRSFNLFIASSESRKQLHWNPISLGWLRNSNYRMRFFSQLAFDELTRERRDQEKLEQMQASQASAREAAQATAGWEATTQAAQQAQALQDAARAAQSAVQNQTPTPQPPK